MSKTKTAQAPAPDTRPPGPANAPVNTTKVDTSNLSPGAARRFERLIESIDNFTSAVQSRAITLPNRE